jgi:aminobenzoyl-glutamate utilization protein B
VLGAAWPGAFNKPLAEALMANIRTIGMPVWTAEDQALAQGAQRTMKSAAVGLPLKIGDLGQGRVGGNAGSDDIAEVSWNVPTVVLRYPGNIPGMIGHHWSSAISMATPIAHKGATAGAKAHAMTIMDLLTKPELLTACQAAFAEQTREVKWKSLIPVETQPPVYLNKEKMERVRPQLQKLRYDPAKYKTYLDQLGIKYPTLMQ